MAKVRLQKLMSDMGICSRRKAEEYITQGRIILNGKKAVLGEKADSSDVILFDGERIKPPKKKKKLYIMLNKPRGYVTTMSDDLDRRCVTDLLTGIDERVYPIGRLDRNSEGMLLFTNDGTFANNIMHPRRHVTKTYRVTVRPPLNEDQLVKLSTGIDLDGKMTLPATVEVLTKEENRIVLRMVIKEGRNRQIRRMCEAVGLEVARLRRIAIGPVKLGMLKPGSWRELTSEEVRALRNSSDTN